eukprot:271184-Pyramimonas_sp.AAC.1
MIWQAKLPSSDEPHRPRTGPVARDDPPPHCSAVLCCPAAAGACCAAVVCRAGLPGSRDLPRCRVVSCGAYKG